VRISGLSNIDLLTFARDTVYVWCFQAMVILDGLKETGHISRWEAYGSNILLDSTLLMCGGSNKGQEDYQCQILLGGLRAQRIICHCSHSVSMYCGGIPIPFNLISRLLSHTRLYM
jgi:hypothetical protein